MSEVELLKAEAARCRQFACLVLDHRVEETLLQMAAECDHRAEEIVSDNVRRAHRLRTLIEEEAV